MSIIDHDLFFRIFGRPAHGDMPGEYLARPDDRLVLLSLCTAFRSKRVMEIGVNRGATAKFLLDNCPWIEHYLGIDVPPEFKAAWKPQESEIPKAAGEYVRGDHRFSLRLLANGTEDLPLGCSGLCSEFDFIFIDGDHTEEGVMRDSRIAFDAIDRPGVICWHDYTPRCKGVQRAINRLNGMRGDRICLVGGTAVCFYLVGS